MVARWKAHPLYPFVQKSFGWEKEETTGHCAQRALAARAYWMLKRKVFDDQLVPNQSDRVFRLHFFERARVGFHFIHAVVCWLSSLLENLKRPPFVVEEDQLEHIAVLKEFLLVRRIGSATAYA